MSKLIDSILEISLIPIITLKRQHWVCRTQTIATLFRIRKGTDFNGKWQ